MFREFILFVMVDKGDVKLTSWDREPEVVGDPGNTTTLTHLVYLYGLVQNRTVGELMDTRGFLCYEYD